MNPVVVPKQKILLKRTKKHLSTVTDQVQKQNNDKSRTHYKHLFNNLFKEYNKIVGKHEFKHDYVNIQALEILLSEMCYLPQYRTKQSERYLDSISDVLNSANNGITLSNIFKFVLIIENIEYSEEWFGTSPNISVIQIDERNKPIGIFNYDGNWYLEQHQKLGVRKLYEELFYNRLAKNRVQTFQDQINQSFSYSPQILKKSRILAEKQRDRMRNFSKKNLLASKSHEQLLIMSKTMKQHKIRSIGEKLQQQQKKRCPFKPTVNRRKSVQQVKDRCLYLFQKSKHFIQSQFQSSIEQRQNKSFQQCTFYPAHFSKTFKSKYKPLAKNAKNLIQRMKQGQHLRQMNKTFKQRGYPKKPSNWTKFYQQQKKRMQYSPIKTGTYDYFYFRQPILTINVQIGDTTQNIDFYSGDSLEGIACKILVKNNLPSICLQSIKRYLKESIQNSNSSTVKIQNGFICQCS